MKQCASNKHSLLHAVGIMLDVVVSAFKHADLVQRLVNSLIVRTVEPRCKSEILSSGHAFIEILIFGNYSHQWLEAFLFSDNVATCDSSAAAAGSQLTA